MNRIQQLRFPNGRDNPPIMTQQEVAARLSDLTGEHWDQSRVSRVEANPDDAPMRSVLAMLQVLGDPLSHLMDNDLSDEGADAGDPLARLHQDLAALSDYAQGYLPSTAVDLDGMSTDLSGLAALCDQLAEKPMLALFGKFDVGKSTIVNALLGSLSMPVSYQPATRVVTYVRHVDDRPHWLPETVMMLDSGFDPMMWKNEDHCMEHKVVVGGLETLRDHGSHRGANGKDSPSSFALVFLDAAILRSCSIIDLPGTANDTLDTDKATAEEVAFDAAVFADIAPGFLTEGSLGRLADVVRRLPRVESASRDIPPLSNLFVVATHAHGGMSDAQLTDDVIPIGLERAWRQLGETTLVARAQDTGATISRTDLGNRFFTFYSDITARRTPLLTAIAEYLKSIQPMVSYRKADEVITTFRGAATQQTQQAIDFHRSAIEDRALAEDQMNELLAAEDQRKRTTGYARRAVESSIAQQRAETRDHVKSCVARESDPEAIERLIRGRFKDKKDAQQNAVSLVLERIQHDVEMQLRRRTEDVTTLINEFIGEYEQASMAGPQVPGAVRVPFNAKGAFAGGLVGLAAFGGLALWASTLGNLGAYILVAQAVSVVSALGITTGGTAAWISVVSAIGGPVTIGIGIVVIAGILGWALLRGSWESRLAKKISSELKKSGLEQQYLNGVDNYWTDTAKAFSAGADNAEYEWQQHLDSLREVTNETDISVLQQRLDALGEVQVFLQGLPWGGPWPDSTSIPEEWPSDDGNDAQT